MFSMNYYVSINIFRNYILIPIICLLNSQNQLDKNRTIEKRRKDRRNYLLKHDRNKK